MIIIFLEIKITVIQNTRFAGKIDLCVIGIDNKVRVLKEYVPAKVEK